MKKDIQHLGRLVGIVVIAGESGGADKRRARRLRVGLQDKRRQLLA